ncbi:MAG: hypothetical protein JWN86_1102 [Planctomycetota bacterium]|nr:hypothetical protein [Planctomycetota bacterium]
MDHRVPPLRTWQEARSARVSESRRAYLTSIARSKLGGDSIGGVTASDLVQETLMAATVAGRQGQGPDREAIDGDICVWLRTILENKIHETFRRENARKRGGGMARVPLPSGIPDMGSTPSDHAIANEERHRLEEALGMLSPEDVQLLSWSVKEGLSRGEISVRLGVSARYARRICKRAEERLREAYRTTRRDEDSS